MKTIENHSNSIRNLHKLRPNSIPIYSKNSKQILYQFNSKSVLKPVLIQSKFNTNLSKNSIQILY